MEELYYVHEENEKGEWVTEFFDTRKDDAFRYFKQKVAMFEGQYRRWEKEYDGKKNEYRWSKDGKRQVVRLEEVKREELKCLVTERRKEI